MRWDASTAALAYGVRIGIRATSASTFEQMTARLPWGWKPHSSAVVDRLYSIVTPRQVRGTSRGYRLYADSRRLLESFLLDDLLDSLEGEAQLCVAELAPQLIFVHAGVVGWRGRAIVIPGRSYSGKSTLVAALLRAGATFYSDEFAVLDREGNVHPFPRLLSLRRPEGGRPSRCGPEAFGSTQGIGPLRARSWWY